MVQSKCSPSPCLGDDVITFALGKESGPFTSGVNLESGQSSVVDCRRWRDGYLGRVTVGCKYGKLAITSSTTKCIVARSCNQLRQLDANVTGWKEWNIEDMLNRGNKMSVKCLFDYPQKGMTWSLAAKQKTNNVRGHFNMTHNFDNASSATYSSLTRLEQFKGDAGFEFMLRWPGLKFDGQTAQVDYNWWAQRSNPVNDTRTLSYHPITIPYGGTADKPFIGLTRPDQASSSSAVLLQSHGYFEIGSSKALRILIGPRTTSAWAAVNEVELWVRPSAWQGSIAYTSFEEPSIDNSGFYRAGLTSTHALKNKNGGPVVEYQPCSRGEKQELGFTSMFRQINKYFDGLTDGDVFGVLGDISTQSASGQYGASLVKEGGAAPHGSQYFIMSDTDGYTWSTLTAVNIAKYLGPRVSAWFRIADTAWETQDKVRIWVTGASSGKELTLLSDSDMDDDIVEGKWLEVQAGLHPLASEAVKVSFGGQMDESNEAIWFDFIRIFGVADRGPQSPCG